MGQDKGSLILKNQRPWMEEKENVFSKSVSRWCPVASWEIGPQCVTVQDKSLNNKCSPTFSSFLSSFIADHDIIWWGNFSQFGPLLTPCSLPACQPLRVGIRGGREFQCCVSAAQECPKNWCVTNTFLATNTKYRTLRVAMGKVKPISAR